MAWDFSTEPEFEQQLDWMREFVREEIWPLETVAGELDQAGLDRIYAPLQEQVRQRGLWAAHLGPELGGQGYGQVKLGLMHEILGASELAPPSVHDRSVITCPFSFAVSSVARCQRSRSAVSTDRLSIRMRQPSRPIS